MRSAVVPAAIVAALGLAAVAPAAAQNYQAQIRNQLATHAASARQNGYSLLGDAVTGSLNDNAAYSQMFNLQAGVRYLFVGVCDQDCSDVDLRIFSPDGTKIAEDIATDDTPVLEFTARASGSYRLSVEMATCSTNPCYWGVQVFARTGGK